MNGCNYSINISLDGVDDNCINVSSLLLTGPSVTLAFCADKRYSLQSDVCRAGEVVSNSVNFSNDIVESVMHLFLW